MNAAPRNSWIKSLPKTRGRLTVDAPLGGLTWFRVGGNAEVLFRPADVDDLAEFLVELPAEVTVTVIGVGSNLLVRDGGVQGVVIRLGGAFAQIDVMDDIVTAGAGALDLNVALTAQEHGLSGLEFLSGVPGTIGGALRMNAGAFGGEMKDVTLSATAIDRDGTTQLLTLADLDMSYRHCGSPEDYIFLSATLQGKRGAGTAIAQKMADIKQAREDSQPTRVRTGGSTFANPDGMKAWELIDKAGCRGLVIGGAQVSEKHCNFLLNLGDATAADIENLGEEVRRRVLETSGVTLEWEIRRIGIEGAKP
ncbi:UDP-N-acetylmuramate dehydrogenase [Magnetospirillum sp. 64-120]|uniref:UDP-N-acetylmuramate dehydrogenase n=1 Tax=Magnetospirillum sp. 64-120 TaxID=1895778 RepID=UPI00092B50C8|nr:UDP-N-acetylmuramate dehydrogenase [Magnetospirillum sp. 64-120]OJX71764.1 MAG: UDP-N-acetylenolpyruvoylglucosamine reductase [Magnetospirillum sp. 64-120]